MVDISSMPGNDRRITGGALTLTDFRRPDEEQRREPRIPCAKEIAILPCTTERDWAFKHVGLYDCSPHGLGLITQEPMMLGEQFLAKLRVGRMTMLIYTVRHCAEIGPQQWKVGAEFSGVIGSPDECNPDAIMSALLNAAQE